MSFRSWAQWVVVSDKAEGRSAPLVRDRPAGLGGLGGGLERCAVVDRPAAGLVGLGHLGAVSEIERGVVVLAGDDGLAQHRGGGVVVAAFGQGEPWARSAIRPHSTDWHTRVNSQYSGSSPVVDRVSWWMVR